MKSICLGISILLYIALLVLVFEVTRKGERRAMAAEAKALSSHATFCINIVSHIDDAGIKGLDEVRTALTKEIVMKSMAAQDLRRQSEE